MDSVLSVQNLQKKYGRVTALKELSLSIPRGAVFGILGPNGSGKTTTLGITLGIIRPTQGNYSWFGESQNPKVRQRIGAILEKPNFYPYLTAQKNLKIVAQIKQLKNPNYQEILEFVGLYERRNDKFATFSLGMKQRLAIGAALLGNPEVLILDEPTNGLDPKGIMEIRGMIQKIAKKGITVVLASHLLDEVEKVCSHVAVLKKGELIFTGKVEELLGNNIYESFVISTNSSHLEKMLSESPWKWEPLDNGFKIIHENLPIHLLNKDLVEKGVEVVQLNPLKNNLEKEVLNLLDNDAVN